MYINNDVRISTRRFHGVMVSTSDMENQVNGQQSLDIVSYCMVLIVQAVIIKVMPHT